MSRCSVLVSVAVVLVGASAANAQWVYWTQFQEGTFSLRRAALDGSGHEIVVWPFYANAKFASGVAVDTIGGKVYWINTDLHGIHRANLDGSEAEILVPGLEGPTSLAIVYPDTEPVPAISATGLVLQRRLVMIYPADTRAILRC